MLFKKRVWLNEKHDHYRNKDQRKRARFTVLAEWQGEMLNGDDESGEVDVIMRYTAKTGQAEEDGRPYDVRLQIVDREELGDPKRYMNLAREAELKHTIERQKSAIYNLKQSYKQAQEEIAELKRVASSDDRPWRYTEFKAAMKNAGWVDEGNGRFVNSKTKAAFYAYGESDYRKRKFGNPEAWFQYAVIRKVPSEVPF